MIDSALDLIRSAQLRAGTPAFGTEFVNPDFSKIAEASNALSAAILKLQGDGDFGAVEAFVERYGKQGETLKADLERLSQAGIPVDIVFEQGVQVLGL